MRVPGLVFAAVILSGGVVCAQAGGPAGDFKQFKGSWNVAHRGYTPSPKTNEAAALLTKLGTHVVFTDGNLAPDDGGKSGYYLTVQLNPGSRPKGIDLTVPGEQGRVLHGIYTLDGQILTLAFGTGDDRPQGFRPADDRIVIILVPVGFRARQ
jgi:uncharacterized protein (TIGR03067 family)